MIDNKYVSMSYKESNYWTKQNKEFGVIFVNMAESKIIKNIYSAGGVK